MGPSPLSRIVSSCCHVACAPTITSEPHARRVHAEQPSTHPGHDDTFPFRALEGRLGSAVDGCGRRLGTVVPCPTGLRNVIDPPRGSKRCAALLDGGHPERRNDCLCAGAIVARLDDTHKHWCVPNNTSATHFLRCMPCTWRTRACAAWCACHDRVRRRPASSSPPPTMVAAPRDDEPDGPVTRRTGEERREAGAHRGWGVPPEPHQPHTDYEEGHPHDARHDSICSGLQTVQHGLANKDFYRPALCANTPPGGPALCANGPTLVCKRLANTLLGQHVVRIGQAP